MGFVIKFDSVDSVASVLEAYGKLGNDHIILEYENGCCGSTDDIKVIYEMREHGFKIFFMEKVQHGHINVYFKSA